MMFKSKVKVLLFFLLCIFLIGCQENIPSQRKIQTNQLTWENGSTKEEYQYYIDDDGFEIKHGDYTSYFELANTQSGKTESIKESEGKFDNGKQVGVWITRFETGEIKAKATYQNGFKEGAELLYFKDGVLKKSTEYSRNMKHGKEKFYYPNGNPKLEKEYDLGFYKNIARYWDINGIEVVGGFIYDPELEKHKRYFKHGQLSEVGSMVDKKREGLWIFYDIDGWKSEEGNFINDEKQGKWLNYDEYGSITAIEFYENGLLHGEFKSYYKGTNFLKETGKFEVGEKDGVWKGYTEDGIQVYEVEYKDGLMDGEITIWYKSGWLKCHGYLVLSDSKSDLLKSRIPFSGRDGEWKIYYEIGSLEKRLIWEEGKRIEYEHWHSNGALFSYSKFNSKTKKAESENYPYRVQHLENGKDKVFYRNGKLYKVMNIKNGKKHGAYISYFENGTIQSKGQYKNGKLIGEWKYYFDNCQISAQGSFNNGDDSTHASVRYPKSGRQGKWKFWHKNGKQFQESSWKDGVLNGVWKKWHKNGKKQLVTNFKYGQYHGEYRSWFYNGNKEIECRYNKGKYDGKRSKWFINGNKREEESYRNMKLHGKKIKWYINGIKWRESNYENGLKHGKSTIWWTDGELKCEFNYKENKLEGEHKSYYMNGALEEHGFYRDGKKRRDWYKYNRLGEQIRKMIHNN